MPLTEYRSTLRKLFGRLDELYRHVYVERQPLALKTHTGAVENAAAPDFDDSGWESIKIGDGWGGTEEDVWFRADFTLPAHYGPGWCLRLELGGRGVEGMVFLDGEPVQAVNVWHHEVALPEAWSPGETHTVAVKGFAGIQSGFRHYEARAKLVDEETGKVKRLPYHQTIADATLCRIDEACESLCFTTYVILETIKALDENDLRRAKLLNAADEAFLLLDWRHPGSETFYESIAKADEYLVDFLATVDAGDAPTVTGVGHAHIDVAWLWPLSVTRGKAARTFATAMYLMDQYPEYVYLQPQPHLYKMVKEDYAELYARIKGYVERGQWVPTGAAWVEMDCNVTSGESLVRQMLYGKRFFRKEFDHESKVLWLPDVFGYSAALPQILKQSGVDYFMTTKISWNTFNRLPHDSFWWEGLDGTRVLTHFATTPSGRFDTYNAHLTPEEVLGTWTTYHDKMVNDEALMSYGWGDGGGGPTKEMLEMARRMADLPGMPRFRHDNPENLFDRLAEKAANVDDFPRWVGELYLEYHRGTYTTQAKSKRANRKSEILMHQAELFAATANALLDAGYPQADFLEAWELILLNQFHDILPGSSINKVYEDSMKQYAHVRELAESARDSAQGALAKAVHVEGEAPAVVVFNGLGFGRTALVEIEKPEGAFVLRDTEGESVPYQITECGVIFEADLPPVGWRTFRIEAAKAPAFENPITVTERGMENAFWKIAFDDAGQITSLYDKSAGREVIAPGAAANVFQAFEDKPLSNNAWEIEIFYSEKMWEASDPAEITVAESGPVRGAIKVVKHFVDSVIEQKIVIYAQNPRIDFETKVDWQASETMLKVAFPVDVLSSRATYEVQFGAVERPTHWNTSWDWARFEVAGQKWADLSEGGYGVALLNDSKYGHDIRDNVMRLTLLKSSLYPDPVADRGVQCFTYALLPHVGDWREDRAGVVPAAYDLNYPVEAVTRDPGAGDLPVAWSLVETNLPNVVIDTVKRAEDTEELIVRLYESAGGRGKGVLKFGRPVKAADLCNLMEEERESVVVKGDTVEYTVTPYQIRTFAVTLK